MTLHTYHNHAKLRQLGICVTSEFRKYTAAFGFYHSLLTSPKMTLDIHTHTLHIM